MLELADPAHPLLKKLLQVAPGTYNHSIQTGNLAEGAAEAIGANPLLARVGAYYHDIGKTVRPDYFVENQIYVGNPHEHMSPNLSKLAITAHVRDGEHLGRVYGLPKPVVDIIKQHHGTSVLAYFYHKAIQAGAAQPGRDSVYEESYRYEEQKPQSKEAAIIMLADSVEAAVRAMENPTRRKIQGVIQEVIKQKVQDGQLDESALTQGDYTRSEILSIKPCWGWWVTGSATPTVSNCRVRRTVPAHTPGVRHPPAPRLMEPQARIHSPLLLRLRRRPTPRPVARPLAPSLSWMTLQVAGVHSLVEVVDQAGLGLDEALVISLVEAVLEAENVGGTVVVAFVDEPTIAALNEQYRALPEPTDVLSFRYADVETSPGAFWPEVQCS